MAFLFLDPGDPRVLPSIVSGKWCADPTATLDPAIDPDSVVMALDIASSILLRLSGFLIHPAGVAEDEYIVSPPVRRLTPNFRPIREVRGITVVGADCEVIDGLDGCIIGQDIYFPRRCTYEQFLYALCTCVPEIDHIRVCYEFGSTITAAARRAVIQLAHEILAECLGDVVPELSDCQLPERVTSVSREGLSYQILDPQQFLERGRTGVSSVDLWLSTINPTGAKRPSGVWTPDAPPAVNHCVRWARTPFNVPPTPARPVIGGVTVVPAPSVFAAPEVVA